MKKQQAENLTTGSVFGNILCFALPYMLSYFLQTLYGMADLFFVGRFHGTDSITAVSIGSQVMHMLTVMIVGLAMGSTIGIGRSAGAGRHKKTACYVGNTAVLFALGSLVLTAVLLLFAGQVVAVMSTPAEAVEGTFTYLRVCFLGIPFITAYNVLSSIFRGLGDAKSPMYFVAVACVCNIGLDYVFIGVFGLGALGAALGTTLAQAISVLAALAVLVTGSRPCRHGGRRPWQSPLGRPAIGGTGGLGLGKESFRLQRDIVGSILKVGIPVAVQDGFIQIAFIVITVIANRRGLQDAAAVGIVEKFIGILFLVPSSLLSAVSALAAQNLGARQYRRAHLTLGYAIGLAAGFGLVASVAVQFAATGILGIFEKNGEVIRLGSEYLRSYVWDCLFAGIHFSFSGYFCAMERSGISFLHNALSIVLVRIPVAYLASWMYVDTLYPMGWAAPLGSLLSVAVCVWACFVWKELAPWKQC